MHSSLFHKSISISQSELIKLLAYYQNQTGFMWLDSASIAHPNNHFSICGWNPKTTILTKGQVTTILSREYKGEAENGHSSNEDPLTLIQQQLDLLPIKEQPKDCALPFWGGAIGYWGYELGGRFERLPKPKATAITLPDMAVGIYDMALVIEHAELSTPLSTVSDAIVSVPTVSNRNLKVHFVSQADPKLSLSVFTELERLAKQIASNSVEEALESSNSVSSVQSESQPELKTNSQTQLQNFTLTSTWQANMTQAQYNEKFEKVQAYLRSGDCYQINLAQRFEANYSGNEWLAYLALRETNQAPFSSFIRLENGAVLSLSPERFLQIKGNQVETKPIKGTRPRSNDKTVDRLNMEALATASKDRAENLMIVDLLRNDLSKVSVAGSVNVPSIFAIESYPAVHHLVSTVTSTLKPGALSVDLLRGAFPGGSITGAPKIRAMEIIHELEPHPRNVYCGAIGYIKPNGDMDTNITIRTLACNNNKIYCWAGGGLVADSNKESEYQETLDKVNKILPVLQEMA